MARLEKDILRDIEIREGNIGLYKDRIPKWQKMVDDMVKEVPVLEQEVLELRKELANATTDNPTRPLTECEFKGEGFDVT